MKNQAAWYAYQELERKCHGMLTELKNSIETLEGDALMNAYEEIGNRYDMTVA